MRKHMKRQLFELLDTMGEALAYVLAHQDDTAALLLENCGQALSFLSMAAQAEGESLRTLAGHLTNLLEDGRIESAAAELPNLRRCLEDQVPDTFEILFLPYKADMFDSMESVVRCAMKDARCHVTLMPVPYYERGQERCSDVLIYEGNRFPSDLPVTNYQTYSLEEMRPDMIVIHNPYDENNFVTQVDPRFFSSKLVQYTDKLVYIPYYLSIDAIQPNIISQPGVVNAWRIFVENEERRRQYLEIMKFPPERVAALGSPKTDAIANLEQYPIPAAWKKAFAAKKVFLLNVSLAFILHDTNLILEQLEGLAAMFEQTPGIAVLYRPHPLLRQTLRSMRPDFLERYDAFTGRLSRLSNAAIDTSPDFHASLAASHAYIGSNSSIVPLYALTQKPLYLLTPQSPFSAQRNGLFQAWAMAFLKGGEEAVIYFRSCPRIFSYNLKTGRLKILASVDLKGEKPMEALFEFAQIYEDKCFFIPGKTSYILELNLRTHKTREWPLPKLDCLPGVPLLVRGLAMGRYLWLVPGAELKVLRFDMESGGIKVLSNFPRELKWKTDTLAPFTGIAAVDQKLWLAPLGANRALMIDPEHETISSFSLGKEERNGFSGVVYDGKCLWFAPDRGHHKVVVYNPVTGESDELDNYPAGFAVNERMFGGIGYANGSVWLTPGFAEGIIRIDCQTREMFLVNEFPEGFLFDRTPSSNAPKPNMRCLIDGGDTFWLLPVKGNMVLGIDKQSGVLRGISLQFDKPELFGGWDAFFQYYPPMKPGVWSPKTCSIETYLAMVLKGEDPLLKTRIERIERQLCNVNGTCGEKIWRYLQERL